MYKWLLMISCLVQYWCKLLIWGAVLFLAESSQSPLRKAAPGSIQHPCCYAGSTVGLCLNPNIYDTHKKKKKKRGKERTQESWSWVEDTCLGKNQHQGLLLYLESCAFKKEKLWRISHLSPCVLQICKASRAPCHISLSLGLVSGGWFRKSCQPAALLSSDAEAFTQERR